MAPKNCDSLLNICLKKNGICYTGCHFPRGHTDIVRRKYLNITGNTDKTRHQKDPLLKYNFFFTCIIIIYC